MWHAWDRRKCIQGFGEILKEKKRYVANIYY